MIGIIHHHDRAGEGDDLDRLLTAPEVAALFRVHVRTIGQWTRQGRMSSVRTPGGHHRYPLSAVRAVLEDDAVEGAMGMTSVTRPGDERWLATSLRDRHRSGFSRTAVGTVAMVDLLCEALTLVEKRNADLTESGQQEWAGVGVHLVIDEAAVLLQTDVRRTVEHLQRYGRKAGVTVCVVEGAV